MARSVPALFSRPVAVREKRRLQPASKPVRYALANISHAAPVSASQSRSSQSSVKVTTAPRFAFARPGGSWLLTVQPTALNDEPGDTPAVSSSAVLNPRPLTVLTAAAPSAPATSGTVTSAATGSSGPRLPVSSPVAQPTSANATIANRDGAPRRIRRL